MRVCLKNLHAEMKKSDRTHWGRVNTLPAAAETDAALLGEWIWHLWKLKLDSF